MKIKFGRNVLFPEALYAWITNGEEVNREDINYIALL